MQPMMLTVAASTALAHARAAHLARSRGIRLLSIKGPVADDYRLRAPRQAADADVWVEPSRFAEFCSLLEAQGWHKRVGRETPSLMPSHSATYIHDDWGCDIDVHHTFPGFFAPPAQVFEALWIGRRQLTVGSTPVAVPSLEASTVIAALHGLRNQNEARQQAEYEQITALLSRSFSAAEQEEVHQIARQGGATWTLRDLLASAGMVVDDAPPPEQLQRQWTLNRTYGDLGSTLGWWTHMRSLPWYRRPGLLARAIWVPRVDVPRNDPDRIPSRAEAWRYQTERWRRGARALMEYFRRLR